MSQDSFRLDLTGNNKYNHDGSYDGNHDGNHGIVDSESKLDNIVISLEDALHFIKNKQNLTFSTTEKYVLEQLRRWSSVKDLNLILNALEAKKLELENV